MRAVLRFKNPTKEQILPHVNKHRVAVRYLCGTKEAPQLYTTHFAFPWRNKKGHLFLLTSKSLSRIPDHCQELLVEVVRRKPDFRQMEIKVISARYEEVRNQTTPKRSKRRSRVRR